jgi:hypothetical protein
MIWCVVEEGGKDSVSIPTKSAWSFLLLYYLFWIVIGFVLNALLCGFVIGIVENLGIIFDNRFLLSP